MKTAVALFAVIAAVCAPTSWAQSDTWCLSSQDREELNRRNSELVAHFDFQRRITERAELQQALKAQHAKVAECRGSTLSEITGALADVVGQGCRGDIQKYNTLVRQFNDMTAEIQSDQQIIATQLRLNRSIYRTCN